MENRNSANGMSAKKVMGLLGLILFALVFIFSCLKNILPVGRVLFATFGIMVYPLSIMFAFFCLAAFLGFSYRRSAKATTYFVITLASLLFAAHAIATFKPLDTVASSKTLASYIKLPYQSNASTLLGSVGNIVCGLISRILGGMGVIVVFVILATIFGGLFVDYQFYGKYQEQHIKKLKTRRLREKVYTSDKNKKVGDMPGYSFDGNEAVGEVSVEANSYESQMSDSAYSQPYYSDEDAVDTITDSTINMYEEAPNYAGNFYSDESQTQTQNQFSDDEIYQPKSYPDVYTPDMDDYRRQFMNATFGRHDESPEPLESTNFFGGNDEEDEENIVTSFPFSSVETTEDDAFSKLLNSNEDEEDEVENDVFGNGFSGFGTDLGVSEPEDTEPAFNPFAEREAASRFTGSSNIDDTPVYEAPVQKTFEPQTSDYSRVSSRNEGFGNMASSYEPSKPPMSQPVPSMPVVEPRNVVVPAKEQKPANPYGVNIGMTGIRYNPPPLSLLATPKKDTGDYTAEQARKTAQLENVLQAFNINAKVVNIVRGPKITRFELSVPLGTSVKKIPQYEDDIAAALAAKTITIRAPIPGSPFVGIELENDTFTTVYQRELFESDAFQNSKDTLPIAIGKDISGEIVVKGLADMVHLLIAGSTGSGKSVFIHNIVLSLIYKYSPEDMKLIMIDPKRVEFNRYNGLPHLITPEVVMGSQKAINALKWCVAEMDRRYDLMSKAGFNNIKPYNKSELVKAGQFEKFPYIVIIVDELAEIMQANKKEAEGCIQRITQLARACGMHMVLATQRPSVDIITGVIKNNIPSRVAFSLQSGIDSKTIINTIGAEKLLGRGDMLFNPTGTSAIPRLQASYATDEEIQKIIDYVKHNNVARYDDAIESAMNAEQVSDDSGSGFVGGAGMPSPKDTVDGYFKAAVKLVMQNGGASVSYLQRRLSIGYSRAARIVDQMEERGYIAAATGAKVRKVLITPEQFMDDFGEDFNSID